WATPFSGVRSILAPAGLATAFAEVDAAIVGGGMTLYESIAAGVPTVAVAVVPAQGPTIRGFAARRLVLDAGAATDLPRLGRRIARTFAVLQADSDWRRRVSHDGPRTVDGHGAQRVARAIAALAETNALA
ncbi:MAG TPA: hypothetical protein VMF13_22370, partial [Luteitalea sp.]|nr:hypothetical protein [Luteitalea sp.]